MEPGGIVLLLLLQLLLIIITLFIQVSQLRRFILNFINDLCANLSCLLMDRRKWGNSTQIQKEQMNSIQKVLLYLGIQPSTML